jgi:hypothetical protein
MWLDPKIPSIAVRISSAGTLLGTGFILTVASESIPGKEWTYVVTAHHVIRGQAEIEIEIPDPLGDHKLSPPIELADWRHPIETADLAIAPLFEAEHNRLAVDLETSVVAPNLVPPLGCMVLYIGIFAPLEVPMARSGTLGALEVPIQKSYPDGTAYSYPGHLIDCRSYGGFSGSPCFTQIAYGVANDTPETLADVPPLIDGKPRELTPIVYQNMLAGMFTAHYSDSESQDGIVSRYGVGVMLRSAEIWRALMTDEAKEERRRWDKTWKELRERKVPSLEDAGASAEQSRDEVMEDFKRISGPLRGHNRDQKPKA